MSFSANLVPEALTNSDEECERAVPIRSVLAKIGETANGKISRLMRNFILRAERGGPELSASYLTVPLFNTSCRSTFNPREM